MDIAESTVDMHSELVSQFIPHRLHGFAAVHSVNLQIWLFFQECDTNSVGSGTNIQHLLLTLHVYGREKTVAKEGPETKAGHMIGVVIIMGDIRKDIIQFFYPNLLELVLAIILFCGKLDCALTVGHISSSV
ncbi:hypothetical protein BMS3Bbin11_01455 [bacterium BMS3Bbin11]|nr:hypothetical protein BMS3Bbin11_01455 [bacterium BMS3Bbin11]